MDKRIAIASMTWARDEEEENLLRKSLPLLAATGLPVFITDGGSGPAFLKFLASFPEFHILEPEGKGLWAQVSNSIKKAYENGADRILYTEPDKYLFFRSALPQFINGSEAADAAGILLAARTPTAFSTFPKFQQMTETAINNCCSEVTGLSEDYTYGPFIMNAKLVSSFQLIKEDIGWGWRPYLFGMAHRLGYQILTATGEFNCPEEQRQDTAAERIYRMKQLQQSIHGTVLSATVDIAGLI